MLCHSSFITYLCPLNAQVVIPAEGLTIREAASRMAMKIPDVEAKLIALGELDPETQRTSKDKKPRQKRVWKAKGQPKLKVRHGMSAGDHYLTLVYSRPQKKPKRSTWMQMLWSCWCWNWDSNRNALLSWTMRSVDKSPFCLPSSDPSPLCRSSALKTSRICRFHHAHRWSQSWDMWIMERRHC